MSERCDKRGSYSQNFLVKIYVNQSTGALSSGDRLVCTECMKELR